MARRIRVGSIVRLRRHQATAFPRQWTRVDHFIPGVEGGVWLDDALEWSRGWNVQDLETMVPKRARRCAQCGRTFRAKPCGFSHAMLGRWTPATARKR